MDGLEKIRENISKCDDAIIETLAERMRYIQDIIAYKKENGVPILQPEQETKQLNILRLKLKENPFSEEILEVITHIINTSKKVQAKSLFSYNIMLIGFMGAGKSTVSAYLGHMLAMDEVEMDAMIVQKEGMPITQIFETYGEEYFRNSESNILIELQKRNQTVVSCGGGVVLRDENIKNMKKHGRVVLLTASPETIFERVKDSTERPLLNQNMSVEFIASLLEKRKERYLLAADIIVNTDNKTIQEICEELIGKLTAID
ncbi:MAG: AAA family ATPase [Eubacteriaceae bacterium]|nr:AAA family ATPase [Eubacteriaceae bacterium]